MKRFPRLHWLRGLLALAVVLSHLSYLISSARDTPLVRCGIAAVPVFFVLSGFVMFQVLKTTPHGFAPALAFLVKRGLRIFPAYWFFLLLTALLVHSHLPTWDDAGGHRNWIKGLTLLPWGPYFPNLPITAAWSLIYEMLFYYLLVLFIWQRQLGIAALTIYFGWALFGESWPQFHLFGVTPLSGLFLSGLLLGALNEYHPRLMARLTPLLFVGLAMTLGYIVSSIPLQNPLYNCAAIPMVAGVLALEQSYRPGIHPYLQHALESLGTVSFSLYVGHTFVLSILCYLLGPPTLATLGLFIGATLLVAYASFRLIENPGMDLAKWMATNLLLHRRESEVQEVREPVMA